jgi:hypothetical protein
MSKQQPQHVDDNSDSDDGNPLAPEINDALNEQGDNASGATGTGTTLLGNITDVAKDLGNALATTATTAATVVSNVASNVASKVVPVAATAPTTATATTTAASPVATDDAVAVSANVSLSEFNKREEIEMGLREFLNSTSLESYVTDVDTEIKKMGSIAFIKLLPGEDISGPVVVSYCNPSISGLSDFVPHYNLFLFHNGEGAELNVDPIRAMLQLTVEQRQQQRQEQPQKQSWRYEFKDSLNRLSLQLRIGEVFNVPVFTVHIMDGVFHTSGLPSALVPIESAPFRYNAKSIGPYTLLDLMLELWMHSDATSEDPYAPVNVLVARGMNELCVKFNPGASEPATDAARPDAVPIPIQTVCDRFNEFIASEEAQSRVTKNALIAVLQNPAVKTKDNDLHFFDIFPSGQYGMYFNEIVRRCDTRDATGPIMIQIQNEPAVSFPLTRTDIIVAALTAVNAALRKAGVHIVAGGGAAVSYYIQDFLKDANTGAFANVIAESGVNMESLAERCRKIPMNDIDCFVFGDVTRQFLLLFSLYMMILYENFYGRAKRYRTRDAVAEQEQRMQFVVPSLSDPIELFMYGNRNTDVNTQLISKRLAKNPKVQLVTQETKQFSQIVHPACNNECNEDAHYMQPIDLVKKDLAEFIELYQISLYVPDQIELPSGLEEMVREQYMSDNMVSLKTTMLDIICIFCDEGKSLFIRIFMARKNPKDFARLRVFVDLYLLRLLQSNSDGFVQYKDTLVKEIRELRVMMDKLNKKYYLEQGHIAAIAEETASELDADRDAFLTLLRSIGRKIVEIPDPLLNVVPFKFRAATGAQTGQVFNNGPGIKYPFDLNAHMSELVAQHMQMQPMQPWLQKVFETIKFTPEMEGFFFSRLEQILDPANPDGNRKIMFNDMPVRSPGMLQLYSALKGIQIDKNKSKKIRKYVDLRYNLLYPIRNFISAQGGVTPSDAYVINIYDKSTINQYLITLIGYVLLKDHLNANPDLMETVNDPANYDDAVNEEIGRILLQWNDQSPSKLRGGSTRKRQRVCRWKNVVTRRTKNGKKRNATKRSPMCKRTRRA